MPGLNLEHLGIHPTPLDKFSVCPALSYAAVLQEVDVVGHLDCRQPMADYDGCATLGQLLEPLEDQKEANIAFDMAKKLGDNHTGKAYKMESEPEIIRMGKEMEKSTLPGIKLPGPDGFTALAGILAVSVLIISIRKRRRG